MGYCLSMRFVLLSVLACLLSGCSISTERSARQMCNKVRSAQVSSEVLAVLGKPAGIAKYPGPGNVDWYYGGPDGVCVVPLHGDGTIVFDNGLGPLGATIRATPYLFPYSELPHDDSGGRLAWPKRQPPL